MECEVIDYLGGGGQGEVYRARSGANEVALKWYYPEQGTPARRAALATVIRVGSPNERFLWPMDIAVSKGVSGFGYIMPLREDRFKGIVDLMKRRVEPTFAALSTAGFRLSDSYLDLHSKGLCYRDINFGNVFFDESTGDVRICDNDNVGIDGQDAGDVGGTIGFMAPEIVRGEASPSIKTDLFSLSVLLFYMLMVHHPLEGRKESEIKCFDQPAKVKLYGTEPIFIFHPSDPSNEPVRGKHDNALAFWPLYPQYLRTLFTKSFTDGLGDPNARVRESEWKMAMVKLQDSIFYCPHCRAENFYDEDALRNKGGSSPSCWSCRRELGLPWRIRVGKIATVMLNHNTRLFPHHVDSRKIYDFSAPVAEVTQHPRDPQQWGLRNVSSDKWVVTTSEGKVLDVSPGQSVTLVSGNKVNFGAAEGELRA
jgi:serine/threonine protein kinase